jgi:hypothetical protein
MSLAAGVGRAAWERSLCVCEEGFGWLGEARTAPGRNGNCGRAAARLRLGMHLALSIDVSVLRHQTLDHSLLVELNGVVQRR